MKKHFSCRFSKSVFAVAVIIMLSLGVSVFPVSVFSADVSGSDMASDIGIQNNLSKEEYDAMEQAGCAPDVWAELMRRYSNYLEEQNKSLELHPWNGKGNDPLIAPSVKQVSCFEDEINDLWKNSNKVMKSVGKNFFSSFDPSDLVNDAINKIKDEISDINIGKMACKAASAAGNYLENFIKNQEQCFDFRKMFQWKKVGSKDFDECLIRAKISLNQNGFRYNVSSSYLNLSEQGKFGLDDLGILGDDGVSRLFDDGNWAATGNTIHSSLTCGELDPAFETALQSGDINVFNPPSQLSLRTDTTSGSQQWVWTPASGASCTDKQGNSVACETRSSCYPINLSLTAPGGTCFQLDSNGNQITNSNNIPRLYASFNSKPCLSTACPDRTTCQVASATASNVTCLGSQTFSTQCGTASSMNCCDPAKQDCSQSIVPICFCIYPGQTTANQDLNYTMWTTVEIGGGADDGDPTNNILPTEYTCPSPLVNNCCNSELNDCETVDVLMGMDQCVDESLICVNFASASMTDSNGESTGVDLTEQISMSELFGLYDYLVIKPDAFVPAYYAEDQGKQIPGQGGVECCATEWCNICPDMVRGAWKMRDMIGLAPNNIGVSNNEFTNTAQPYAHVDAYRSEVAADWGTSHSVYFGGAPTGNVFADREGKEWLALQADITQPPALHCLKVKPVPSEMISCAHYDRKSGFWNSTVLGGMLCDIPVLGSLFSALGANCEEDADPCADVPELPGEYLPYEPDLLREGLPIANIAHSGDWKGEDPKLCSDYAQCEDMEFEFDAGGAFWNAECTSEQLSGDQQELCCAARCDVYGKTSSQCAECAPQVFGCPEGWSPAEKLQRASCATSAIVDTITSSSLITPEICSENLCNGYDTMTMCGACGQRYSCAACIQQGSGPASFIRTAVQNACQTCLTNYGTGTTGTTDTTTDDTDPAVDDIVPVTNGGSSSGGGGHADQDYEEMSQELKTPATPQATAAPTWKQQPSVAPQQAPASSGNGLINKLKGLF